MAHIIHDIQKLTKFETARGVFIHDPWIHHFSTGDTDDWVAMFIEKHLKLSHLTIYIPYSESKYGKTRYEEVIRLIPSGLFRNNEIIIDYTMSEISGRLIYETSYLNPEIYDISKEDQLLDGFKILVKNFQKGDSIVALIPSNLLFGRNGSFINKIPPFTPMKINLKIK